jgi:hypothetical protein
MEATKSAPQPQKTYRFLDLVMALFVTVLITSNIASSAKIVDWGFSLWRLTQAPCSFPSVTSLVMS